MSLLLRHPGCVPSLFSRGVEAEAPIRAPFDPFGALSRHILKLRTLPFRRPRPARSRLGAGRPGSSSAALAMMAVTEVPLLKAAAALLCLSLPH